MDIVSYLEERVKYIQQLCAENKGKSKALDAYLDGQVDAIKHLNDHYRDFNRPVTQIAEKTTQKHKTIASLGDGDETKIIVEKKQNGRPIVYDPGTKNTKPN